MSRNTQPTSNSGASGGYEIPRKPAVASSKERERETTSSATAAISQLTEYSTRICARRSEVSTSASNSALVTVITLRKRSIRIPSDQFLGDRRRRRSYFSTFTKTPSST